MHILTITLLPSLKILKKHLLERYQPCFQSTKLNTYHFETFAYVVNSEETLNPSFEEEKKFTLIDMISWSFMIHDDKAIIMVIHYPVSDAIPPRSCHPIILTPYTIVWFPDDLCL